MPKGVYDRSKSKEQRAAEKKAAPAKKEKTPKAAKAKAAPAKKAAATPKAKTPVAAAKAPVAKSWKAPRTEVPIETVRETFGVLNQNLAVLVSSRGALAGSPLLAKVDAEIDATLELITSAREKAMGKDEEEAPEVEEAPIVETMAPSPQSNGPVAHAAAVPPLPPAPQWQPPPGAKPQG